MTRYAVRAANITKIIELVDAETPQAAIELAQAQFPTRTFIRPAAINAADLQAHLDNKDYGHLDGSWYDCVHCSFLAEQRSKRAKVSPDDEPVDLVASGYEWMCPKDDCGVINTEIEVTEIVICKKCGRGFETSPPEHAHG
jgi:hypothetical protein